MAIVVGHTAPTHSPRLSLRLHTMGQTPRHRGPIGCEQTSAYHASHRSMPNSHLPPAFRRSQRSLYHIRQLYMPVGLPLRCDCIAVQSTYLLCLVPRSSSSTYPVPYSPSWATRHPVVLYSRAWHTCPIYLYGQMRFVCASRIVHKRVGSSVCRGQGWQM